MSCNHGHSHQDHLHIEETSDVGVSLYGSMDLGRVNSFGTFVVSKRLEIEEKVGDAILRPFEEEEKEFPFVMSDTDETDEDYRSKFLIFIPFKNTVKINALVLRNKEISREARSDIEGREKLPQGSLDEALSIPKTIKIYKNVEVTDFDMDHINSLSPTRTITISENLLESEELTFRLAQFAQTQKVTILVENSSNSVSKLSFLGFKGSNTGAMTAHKGIIKNSVYEASAQLKDHKTKADSAFATYLA